VTFLPSHKYLCGTNFVKGKKADEANLLQGGREGLRLSKLFKDLHSPKPQRASKKKVAPRLPGGKKREVERKEYKKAFLFLT